MRVARKRALTYYYTNEFKYFVRYVRKRTGMRYSKAEMVVTQVFDELFRDEKIEITKQELIARIMGYARGARRENFNEKSYLKLVKGPEWRNVIVTLAGRYSDELVRYYLNGEGLGDIARALGKTKVNVKKRIQRGRKMLDENMKILSEMVTYRHKIEGEYKDE